LKSALGHPAAATPRRLLLYCLFPAPSSAKVSGTKTPVSFGGSALRSSLSVVVVTFALAGSIGGAAAQYYPPPPPGYPPPYAQPGYAAPPLPPPGAIYDPRDDGNDAPVGGPYVPYPPPPAARV